MRGFKLALDFYVFGNMHVALSAACMSVVTMRYFGVTDFIVPLFIFFATLLSYNFIRLYRRADLDSWFYQWVTRYRKLLWVVTSVSLMISGYLAWSLDTKALILLIPLSVLTYFYTVPLVGKSSLRSLPGFKLFLISSVWATVTVLLPAIQYEVELTKELLLVFIQRILFIAAITLPFDLRDLNFDKTSLKTVPQVYGVEKTKKIGLLLLMVFLGLNFFKDDSYQYMTIEFVITLLALGLLLRAQTQQSRYYSAFFVEALPIIWLVGLYVI